MIDLEDYNYKILDYTIDRNDNIRVTEVEIYTDNLIDFEVLDNLKFGDYILYHFYINSISYIYTTPSYNNTHTYKFRLERSNLEIRNLKINNLLK